MALKWLQYKIKSYLLPALPLLVLLSLLAVTWIFFETRSNKSQEIIHSLLQEKVQSAISDYAIKSNPNITKIEFHKIWTKDMSADDEIEVFFTYSIVEEKDKQESTLLIEGEAVLNQSEADKNHWILNNFKVSNSLLDFSKPMLIKASP